MVTRAVGAILQEVPRLRDLDSDMLAAALSIPQHQHVATFALDCSRLAEVIQPFNKTAVSDLCRAVDALPEIVGCVCIYPRIYFDLHDDVVWQMLGRVAASHRCGVPVSASRQTVNVTICSPNANKPLHPGHARNMCLGMAISKLLERIGHEVLRTCVFSDIGIHILKAFAAYQRLEAEVLCDSPSADEVAGICYRRYEEEPQLFPDANALLSRCTSGDVRLARAVHQWTSDIIRCFERTFESFGVSLHATFRESDNARWIQKVEKALSASGQLRREADESAFVVPAGAEARPLYLRRSGGTCVYMLQLMATTLRRFEEFAPEIGTIYCVSATEQERVLAEQFEVLERCGFDYADRFQHVAYGLVLSNGERIRSRLGAVTIDEIKGHIVDSLTMQRAVDELHGVSRGACAAAQIIFYMLRTPRLHEIDLRLDSLLGPEMGSFLELVDIERRLRRTVDLPSPPSNGSASLSRIMHLLLRYPSTVARAAQELDPSILLRWALSLCRVVGQQPHGDGPGGDTLQLPRGAAAIALRFLSDCASLCNLDLVRCAPCRPWQPQTVANDAETFASCMSP